MVEQLEWRGIGFNVSKLIMNFDTQELHREQELQHEQIIMNQSLENQSIHESVDAVYPNILICGASGTGKSTSLRNLNKEQTVIINTERKVLPFREARQFKHHVNIHNLNEFYRNLNGALESANIQTIVIDSLTSLVEMVYFELVRNIEKSGDNVMVAWSQYKDTIHDILLRSKAANKFVVFLAVEDSIQDEMMRVTKTVAVQGSLKGKIAKEFEIALWTKIVDHDDPKEQYKFVTNGDSSNESKSPMDMFDRLIPNDLNQVLQTAYNYFNEA